MKIRAILTIAALMFPYQDADSAPLDVFRDCDVCPEMIKLPMGSFMMGAKPNEVRRAWLLDGDAWKSVYRKDSEWFTKLDELPRHIQGLCDNEGADWPRDGKNVLNRINGPKPKR